MFQRQDIETTFMSINRQMDKDDAVYLYNESIFVLFGLGVRRTARLVGSKRTGTDTGQEQEVGSFDFDHLDINR